MPSVLQVNVGLNPVVVWNGRAAPGVNTLLLWNSDTTNTVYVGDTSTISPTSPNTIPLHQTLAFLLTLVPLGGLLEL